MPMVKNLEEFHQELMDIAQESNRLSHTSYSSKDIVKLQERLQNIDMQYKQGAFNTGNYEERGLAQVSDELDKVHRTLHSMLAKVD